jgi:hypothetical protein
MSKDPIGFAARQANLFAYVENSPLGSVDPFGLGDRVKWGGVWFLRKSDVDQIHGPHYHNMDTGVKYFPERGEFFDPGTRKWTLAGKKWAREFNRRMSGFSGLIFGAFWEIHDIAMEGRRRMKDPCNKKSFLQQFEESLDDYLGEPTMYDEVLRAKGLLPDPESSM